MMINNIDTGVEVDQGSRTVELDLEILNQDMRYILVYKAEGDAETTKVNNTKEIGGI